MDETAKDGVKFQIFISYARPDQASAESIYHYLKKSGFDVWLDIKRLKPGQNWDFEINVALHNSSFIVVLLSKNSVDRRGYVQREISIALDKLKEKLINDIYMIQIIIDADVIVPQQLKFIQNISASKPGYEEAVADSINSQIQILGGERMKVALEEDIHWTTRPRRESWDGLPGYEYDVQLIELSSELHENINDISDFIRANFLEELFRLRRNKIEQNTDLHSFTQDRWRRTDTFSASCAVPVVKNRVVSIKYLVDWYGAGAAHPNHHFSTFCFLIDPLLHISDIRQIFSDEDKALSVIERFSFDELRKRRTEEGELMLEETWILEGTRGWESFPAFSFSKSGVEFLFPPYQVGPYAAGMFDLEIPYKLLKDFIANDYQSALAIRYL